MSQCNYISVEIPFLKTLAGWILQEFGHTPAELTKVLILLPNRRACRALREAFLECTGGTPLLLPRMQPLGELDDDANMLISSSIIDTIPPAMPSLRRELILTRIVRAFKTRMGKPYSLEQSAQLARQLGQLLDDVAREDLTLDALEKLVPENFAEHWQQTLQFLEIIAVQWPELLASEGAIDAIDHRTRILKATAAAWQENPPQHPIIAAGSTGSQPATAALLATIAKLPKGQVILAGLDTAMPQAEWDILTETHPQYVLRQLITHLGIKRESITPLTPATLSERSRLLSALFQPPASTANWSHTRLPLRDALRGLSLLTAPTQHDEARMIAIALRETLETPEKTAALITPDRTLARMVSAQLSRLDIDIDDSAGTSLGNTPAGCFLRLAIDMTASEAAPAALLSLLRHPLAAIEQNPADCRKFSREIETALLRGLRRSPGLESLANAHSKHLSDPARDFLKTLSILEKPLRTYYDAQTPIPLRTLLEAHIAFAQSLATSNEEQGANRLWRGDSGEQVAAFLAELVENADLLPEIEPQAYAGFFNLLITTQTFRPKYGKHPRLHIVSPIEARLQSFNRVILASLNEGTWPQTATPDPWMSRPMREQFGLPATDRSIGQSAHDFAMLCSAPEVILSRSEKVEGSPTIPSRWLVRLRTLIEGLDKTFYKSLACEHHYASGIAHLHRPADIPMLPQPTFAPPLSARPNKLAVTAIDMWVKNPYNLYAKYILNLRPLDELDQEPDASDYGQLIHKAMEILTLQHPTGTIANIQQELLEAGKKAFAPMMDRPAIVCLWWPRFEAMIPWLSDLENARRETGAIFYSEVEGKWTFSVDDKPFTITAKLDRIEINNHAAIIADYKTGTPPSEGKVEEGLANQLPLQALIALNGTFEKMENPKNITSIEYWYLGGNAKKCDIKTIATSLIEPARTRLENLVREFANESTAYTAPLNPSTSDERINDYEHLTRKQEWDSV